MHQKKNTFFVVFLEHIVDGIVSSLAIVAFTGERGHNKGILETGFTFYKPPLIRRVDLGCT